MFFSWWCSNEVSGLPKWLPCGQAQPFGDAERRYGGGTWAMAGALPLLGIVQGVIATAAAVCASFAGLSVLLLDKSVLTWAAAVGLAEIGWSVIDTLFERHASSGIPEMTPRTLPQMTSRTAMRGA